MKDQVFEGATVEDAVGAAARALGTAPAGLRYVVLDPGQAPVRGLEARKARIAVLFDGSRAAAPAAVPAPARESAPRRPAPAVSPAGPSSAAAVAADIRALVRELARAVDTDLAVDIDTTDEALTVRLGGAGKDFLLEDDADVLESLEYLLQLMYRRAIEPRRLIVDCEGYRSDRDRELREEALKLAAAVAGDGVARKTRALNSYERRVVHTTLTDHPAVHTFSVGEGSDRRVTVAPRPAGESQG
jgi:spoIIIJ-associated protein